MAEKMAEEESDRFFLEKEQLVEDIDSEYHYEEVPLDEEFVTQDIEEDLNYAVQVIQNKDLDLRAQQSAKGGTPKPSLTQRPEVVDDFVRNFLMRMGMHKTLDCFQTEWYELQEKGELKDKDVGAVPDVYTQNQQLNQQIQHLDQEVTRFRDAAFQAKDSYVKLRKERDYHRMHHKRVVQEKNKLIADIKRLKNHYASYEPTLRQLKQKYETAMKEKMLTKLERDRAMGQVQGLKNTLQGVKDMQSRQPSTLSSVPGSLGPTQQTLSRERASWEDKNKEQEKRHPNDTDFPPDNGVNPHLSQIKTPCAHLTRTGGFRLTNTFEAHAQAVSGVALHPRKQILATTSDDHTWKMWAVPSGDIIMTGEGHTDWVSDCQFHPGGARLATVSGDTTVKVWDFAKAKCIHTFIEHTHAVWGCSWHSCGDFLASCSMDNTSKIWDLNSLRCRYTLRGHTDSVNAIEFLPFSNTLITCSADKTLSLWDGRTGLCAQTFYGHMQSVNHVAFSLKGDRVASCDSFGVVKIWDVRTSSTVATLECGPHPANNLAFDPSGGVLAIASNDSTVRMYDIEKGKIASLSGHEDAVQCLVFDKAGEFLISGGSDHTVRIWS